MARSLCRAKKAGHTGTLDPMASGLLPICFGEATKFSNFALEADKGYLATVYLGVTTTTADREGEIVETKTTDYITDSMILSVLSAFAGEIEQVPPMFSALKHQGKALYKYAHLGIDIERKARRVFIDEIRCLKINMPSVDIQVRCSKGTYIRTLAADIGEKLGCGAHLSALRRNLTGYWHIGQAIGLDELEKTAEPRDYLLPADALVKHLPKLVLSLEQAKQLYFGQPLTRDDLKKEIKSDLYRLYIDKSKERFIGLGQVADDKTLHSVRLLSKLPD
jgi:tRNA pseudouridine55 synthase